MFHRLITAAALAAACTAAQAETKIPFTLDWKFEGPAAPYFMALDKGYFADADLDVEVLAGVGSTDAIPKVATGAYPMGFGDINVLIKFLDQNPDAPITGIMMTYNKPPFAIIGRKSLGIESPKDLEGKILGAPPPTPHGHNSRSLQPKTIWTLTRSPSNRSVFRHVNPCWSKARLTRLRDIIFPPF